MFNSVQDSPQRRPLARDSLQQHGTAPTPPEPQQPMPRLWRIAARTLREDGYGCVNISHAAREYFV